ncbi:type IX secretion system periplasmic lipoprotein PorW/SprE [Prevotella sp.]|uniref:type IX secretion system periplasmic lipoprotein PorW/SprE n=1 Tax=Prevotella sp. TaxID=59823 RepID=UPI003DA5CBD1
MKHNAIYILAALISITSIYGCSTQQNTAKSRWWHAFHARYNTYYNGSVAYIDGSLEKENGNRDNFTEKIPLYTVGNKASRQLGGSNFDKAIEKCKKAIKLYSIKRRPEWNPNKKKTQQDIEWLSRREYNPFLWKAWLLMGRAQFYKGDFSEAAATFAYMSRLYSNQPAIYGKARAWLAKCYIEEDWLYDAEDVIRNIQRDSIHWRAQKEWDYTYADYYIHNGNYGKAIPYLRKVISHEMRRKQRAREWFLMGQLFEELGNKENAYNAYRHVIRLNPPYQLTLNARVGMTEVMAGGKQKQMIAKLKRMATSDNNKDYQEQIYYAIGNIYLAKKDTTNAIAAYEQGKEKAIRNGIEKGVLLLKLGNLYWTKEQFGKAKGCYDVAIGLLDKERKDYQQLTDRQKVLEELVPFTDAVELQDSLQRLARMNESSRNVIIDKMIIALKKKEKKELNAQLQTNTGNAGADIISMKTEFAMQNNSVDGKNTTTWYFYNPMTVARGKETFTRTWGKRDNVDNWQRINKTVVAGINEISQNSTIQSEINDSVRTIINDSAEANPHKREYYIKQLPLNKEKLDESDNILMNALYNSGVIFKDKLDNLVLGEKALRRIEDNYPKYKDMDNVYYHLYLLYARENKMDIADSYIEKLKRGSPQSKWTTLLSDPLYKENAKWGEHIEDSIYAATYDAFKAGRYTEVDGNTYISEHRFPSGANRDKFLFIGGLNKLNNGNQKGCLNDMNTLVKNFPESALSQMAGMIINGVKAGRKLHGGKFDIGDVWSRRTEILNDSDSIKTQKFNSDSNIDFVYMLVYNPDSVNENQLLFEIAKYNFTSYMVRNFDIQIENIDDIHRMVIKGFLNYDEALQYARELHRQTAVINLAKKARPIIISKQNLPLLGNQFSYEDYEKFYNKHFAPIKTTTSNLLIEPANIVTTGNEEETMPLPKAEKSVDKKATEKKTEEKTFDLEDEYYDLEGF